MRALFAVALLVVLVVGCGDRSSSPPSGGHGSGSAGSGKATDAASAEAAPTDDQSLFDQERQPERIIAAVGLRPGMVVADIGAGSGLLTVHVARAVFPGGKVVATDIDGEMLKFLAARMEAAGFDLVVETRQVKPTEPGLEAERYDLVLLAQVDHYFDDRVAWFTQVAPALKPDGRLAITNRVQHRAAAMAAAASVGFELVTEVNDIPGQFVALFRRPPRAGKKP